MKKKKVDYRKDVEKKIVNDRKDDNFMWRCSNDTLYFLIRKDLQLFFFLNISKNYKGFKKVCKHCG